MHNIQCLVTLDVHIRNNLIFLCMALKLIYKTSHLIELSKIAKKTIAQNGTIEIAEKIDELAKS